LGETDRDLWGVDAGVRVHVKVERVARIVVISAAVLTTFRYTWRMILSSYAVPMLA
jgi:hypothetical protein